MTDRHPTAWLLGTPTAILAACYLIVGEWWVAVGIAALVLLLALGAALHDARERLAQIVADFEMLERENNEHAAENARLTALTTPVPLLSIVPPQRDGSDEWPAIVRAVEDEVEA